MEIKAIVKIILLYTMAFLISLFPLKAQDHCVLKKDEDGIKVYTCETVGSDFYSVKASFEVDATLSQYASIILDIEQYKNWNTEARNARLLKRISETELIYYTDSDAPWPIKDRDLVLHLKLSQDPKTKVITIDLQCLPDYIPAKEDFVRIPLFHSTLKITPISKYKVKANYYLEAEPGGQIPAWVANLVCTRIPINAFTNLKNRVASQADHRPSVASVKNW